eukprot:gene8530-10115_t
MNLFEGKKVAVIGAGAAGLVTATTLLQNGFDITVYEKSANLGGVWNYAESNAMYESLRTNLPKEIMAFSIDDPFTDADLDESNPHSFLSHYEVQRYLERYAHTYGLRQHIKFFHSVEHVYKQVGSHVWTLEVKDGFNTSTHFYDAVLVSNGHFNLPYTPEDTAGFTEYFHGESYHSSKYDEVKQKLTGKNVLVVGSMSSGTDMARELVTIATDVYVSDRSSSLYEDIHTLYNDVAANLHILPGISSIQEDVEVEHDRCVRPLYQQLFAIKDPSLVFMGLPFKVVPFPLFYYQAQYVAAVLSGRTPLPSTDDKYLWLETLETYLRATGMYSTKYHFLGGPPQWDYCKFLAEQSGLIAKSGDKVGIMESVSTTTTTSYSQQQHAQYLQMLETIYDDNMIHRVLYPGAPDTYRERVYTVDSTKSTNVITTKYRFSTADGVPTLRPTVSPTLQPTVLKSSPPSGPPSSSPTSTPSVSPQPTSHPSSSGPTNTYKPTVKPTQRPSRAPSKQPTVLPTVKPSITPTKRPSQGPSVFFSTQPSPGSTAAPTLKPTIQPTCRSTTMPTLRPTSSPSTSPSAELIVAGAGYREERLDSPVMILVYVLTGLTGIWTQRASTVTSHGAYAIGTPIGANASTPKMIALQGAVQSDSGSSSVVLSSLHSSEMSDISNSVYSDEQYSEENSSFLQLPQSEESLMEEGGDQHSQGCSINGSSGGSGDDKQSDENFAGSSVVSDNVQKISESSNSDMLS